MKFYSLDISEVLEKLHSSEAGISQKEADVRLQKDGKNRLQETHKQSNFIKFLREFKDLMIIILIS